MNQSTKPKALIIAGDGINSEQETANAFQLVGFESEIVHLNDLIHNRMTLDQLSLSVQAVALPGGFSFGDDISSGKILALKIKHGLKWDFQQYAKRGGLVIGICNGFQALIRLGIFGKEVSITTNQSGRFVNRWVKVAPLGRKSVWLDGVGTIDLPVRHGEGRIVIHPDNRAEVMQRLERLEMLCLQYLNNPNGSENDTAGLCDSSGRILGLMPHPEAFVRWTAHPGWTSQPDRAGAPGEGLILFENAYQSAINAL